MVKGIASFNVSAFVSGQKVYHARLVSISYYRKYTVDVYAIIIHGSFGEHVGKMLSKNSGKSKKHDKKVQKVLPARLPYPNGKHPQTRQKL